jgi:hypothetical protein
MDQIDFELDGIKLDEISSNNENKTPVSTNEDKNQEIEPKFMLFLNKKLGNKPLTVIDNNIKKIIKPCTILSTAKNSEDNKTFYIATECLPK